MPLVAPPSMRSHARQSRHYCKLLFSSYLVIGVNRSIARYLASTTTLDIFSEAGPTVRQQPQILYLCGHYTSR